MSNRSDKKSGSQAGSRHTAKGNGSHGTRHASTNGARRSTQNGSAPDAITLLSDDHQEVRDAFSEYEELGDKAFVSKKKQVDEICTKLLVHAQIEEEILYPAFAKAVKEGRDLEREARVEHASARDLIRQLQSMDSDEELFDAKVTVLSEYIEHHVKEEESEMFPLMRTAGLDIEGMGQQLWERKQELMEHPERLLEPDASGALSQLKGSGQTGASARSRL